MTMMMRSSFTNFTALLQKQKTRVFPKAEYLMKFDGCSKGNPGTAACGAVLYHNDIEIWCGSKFLGYNETNNYAEYMGLIIGLEKAIELNIRELAIEGDSMIVIKQMNGEYKVKSSNISELNKQAMKLKIKFNNISFSHIYRENNKRADELCNREIEQLEYPLNNRV